MSALRDYTHPEFALIWLLEKYYFLFILVIVTKTSCSTVWEWAYALTNCDVRHFIAALKT